MSYSDSLSDFGLLTEIVFEILIQVHGLSFHGSSNLHFVPLSLIRSVQPTVGCWHSCQTFIIVGQGSYTEPLSGGRKAIAVEA